MHHLRSKHSGTELLKESMAKSPYNENEVVLGYCMNDRVSGRSLLTFRLTRGPERPYSGYDRAAWEYRR